MGLVAQWITRLTTDQEIPFSTPGMLECLYRFRASLHVHRFADAFGTGTVSFGIRIVTVYYALSLVPYMNDVTSICLEVGKSTFNPIVPQR